MNVLISADAEGITGVFKKAQDMRSGPDFGYFRKLMARDVNAAIRGAFDAGADSVTVSDDHNDSDNLLIDDLDPRALLLSGTDKPLVMAEGLQTGEYDALMLVGYHSRKGARGIIPHTFYYPIVVEATVNGVPFGEAEFVAGVAGYFDVPTVLLTGDDCVVDYAKQTIPGIKTVEVKRALGNGTAILKHPDVTGPAIEQAAREAIEAAGTIEPLKIEGDIEFEVTFFTSTMAQHATKVAGFELVEDGRESTVRLRGNDFFEMYKLFLDALWQSAAFNDRS